MAWCSEKSTGTTLPFSGMKEAGSWLGWGRQSVQNVGEKTSWKTYTKKTENEMGG